MNNEAVHEDLIKITKYEVLSELPDPFVFDDGRRVASPDDWRERRAEIYKTAVDLQFGGMPPEPEFLEVDPLYLNGSNAPSIYRITTGTREKPIVMSMYVFRAEAKEKAPAVITGDFCFSMLHTKEFIEAFTKNGINLVAFNRTELAPDIAGYNLAKLDKTSGEYALASEVLEGLKTHDCGGAIRKTYPGGSFGATAAWAWGYSRCVDALEILDFTDLSMTVFTGISRGGKTCALAGAVDERAAIVNPCATCMGGYSSYRINIAAITEDGEEKVSEPLSNIFYHFPAWMGRELENYIGKEETLPFDSHYFKALVAPRVLFVAEAASDIWSNPVGSWQTTVAAAEVWKLLGCEENLYWYFRRGYHAQTVEDVAQLVNIIKHKTSGEPINDKFFKLPFKPIDMPFSWKAPV